jgi:hypothetical protein
MVDIENMTLDEFIIWVNLTDINFVGRVDLSPYLIKKFRNYIVYKDWPGWLLHELLANNTMSFYSDINERRTLKYLQKWILDYMPKSLYGSANKIGAWTGMYIQAS